MQKTFKFTNKEIVKILKEVLAAMEVKNFNIFKIRAYQNVIIAVDGLTMSVFNLWENNKLDDIVGMGPMLKSHINELFSTGKVTEFEAIKHDLPQGMFELIGLRGIGAKRAFRLAKEFNIIAREDALEKIKQAAYDKKIQELDGFGEKTEQQILESISELKKIKSEKQRILLATAEIVAGRIVDFLKGHPEIEDAIALGSLRRRNSMVGDLDIAIKTNSPVTAINHFLKFPEIEEILVKGDKRAAVVVGNGLQVDIRVCEAEEYGSMIQYFTGSKSHNIVLRTYALEKGMSLSEYGIKKNEILHKFENEKGFYEFIGLEYITPELREGKNEVELASKKKLPRLIEKNDIKGDLHSHTIASDGLNTLQEMVSQASQLGFQYLGVTDHAPSIQSRGYDDVVKLIESTRKAIDSINSTQLTTRVLFGYEVNILTDATLSLPDELLTQLDFCIASIHGGFNQDRETITKRLISALENPYVTILGHPAGRLINEREAYDVDWRAVFSAAKDNDKILEINCQPNRMDLSEDLIYEARSRAIDLVISTDAHSVDQFLYMAYGVDLARRGWCLKDNIINTRNLEGLLNRLNIK